MHTTDIGDKARVHHHGDWSGDAIIAWETNDGKRHEAIVPAWVLLRASWAASRRKLVGQVVEFLEGLEVRGPPF